MKNVLKKIKLFVNKYYPEILAVAIPILILIIASIFAEIYPFGKITLVKYDGYYQYPGFTSYFRRVLLGKANLFYSFKGLLGYNFYATAVYYLFNPTNLLCVFFDNNHIIDYYNLIIYLRIGLCGLFMCKYLRYKFKDNNSIYLSVFSIAYALMAYNVCYFFNFMYFDVVALFPLVMIGLEKLIYEDKIKMYIITLTLSILSNFYIGFMVCIFSLLYFIYNYILLKNRNKKIIKNFVISSILCGVMSSIFLIPVIYELFQGKVELYTDPTQIEYFKFNLNFLNIFYKSSPGSMSVFDIKYGSVNIYCSLLVFILVIKYFFNKKISTKEKIVTGSFIAFFLLSISFNLIDYFWHVMQRPIWYPNRYIFTFTFFLIMIAYKSFKYRDGISMKWWVKLIVGVLYIGLMIYPMIKSVQSNDLLKYVCILLSAMLIAQYLCFTENKYAKVLIIGLFLIEITLNSVLSINRLPNTTNIENYDFDNQKFTKATTLIKEHAKDKKFYRMEYTDNINYNMGATYDYNGISIFNSLRNVRVMKFLGYKFGYTVRDMASAMYNHRNLYLNAILDIEYMEGAPTNRYFELVGSTSKHIYVNNDAIGLGFMVNKEIYNATLEKGEIKNNTKELVRTMTGLDEDIYIKQNNYKYIKTERIYDETNKKYLIRELDYSSKDDAYTLVEGVASEDSFIITDKGTTFYTSVHILINDEEVANSSTIDSIPTLVKKGEKFSIKFYSTCEYDAVYSDVYLAPLSKYKSFTNDMKSNLLNIEEYKTDNHIIGTVTATKEKPVLFTSIPYDKGWRIYVDGKKTNYNECYDTFICLDLEEGTHDIELLFIPRGFILGSIISGVSLIISIVFIKKNKKKRKILGITI